MCMWEEVHSSGQAPSDPCLLNNHNVNGGYTSVLESTDFILNSLTFSWTNTHMLVHPLPIWQAFPWLPVDPKKQRARRGGVLGFTWSFVLAVSCLLFKRLFHLFHCGEQGGGLAFSGCYKICSLYKPPNLSTRSFFLFVPRPTLISSITPIFPVVCLVLLERMCEMDSTLHSEVAYLLTTHFFLIIEIILIASI